MKSMKFRAIAVLVAVAAAAMPVCAQFKVGPRVGINVNSMHFDESVFNSDNRTGFTGGIEAEFTVPVVGIAFDASVMYTRNSTEIKGANNSTIKNDRDFIEIPVNLKWKMGIPVIGNVIQPYIYTGPSFAFLTSKRAMTDALRNKSVDVSWNVGVGVELIKHLQIGAGYGFGINKAYETISGNNATNVDAKSRCWTITAAWLF